MSASFKLEVKCHEKKITIFNFIISAILVFTVTACGQKSEENKNTSVSTNGSDMHFFLQMHMKRTFA